MLDGHCGFPTPPLPRGRMMIKGHAIARRQVTRGRLLPCPSTLGEEPGSPPSISRGAAAIMNGARERREALPLWASSIVEEASREFHTPAPALTPAGLAWLVTQPAPVAPPPDWLPLSPAQQTALALA